MKPDPDKPIESPPSFPISCLSAWSPFSYISLKKKKERSHFLLGNKLNPATTKEKPDVHGFHEHEKGQARKSKLGGIVNTAESFTVALTDPDAPSMKNLKWSEMCCWIATQSGDVVEYKPPGPPKYTSYHRYTFVLLAGNNSNLTAPDDRQYWGTGQERHGVADGAKNQNLTVVGANFFYAKHECYLMSRRQGRMCTDSEHFLRWDARKWSYGNIQSSHRKDDKVVLDTLNNVVVAALLINQK